jgi:A/G-specific adenine glycosylase
MDWGANVKKNTENPNRRSAHYTRQSPFEGSFRQRRSRILRILLDSGLIGTEALQQAAGFPTDEFFRVIAALEKDGLIARANGKWRAG